MEKKKIFIIGGSGSLGNKLIERYIKNNKIVCYSRDECKHWSMGLFYKSENLSFIIGDIRDYNRIEMSLLREKPNIVIIAAALKHIDKCEYACNECILTDMLGTKNVVDAIEKNINHLSNLEAVCFISTDKACSPVNVYGMCKAVSEKLMIEKSSYMKTPKFICVRYGNVLNSRGSIIPMLHKQGRDTNAKEFVLTHPEMTRFVMTLDQSVNLIEHAILKGESGDVVIPSLISMNVKDLMDIFSELYNKPIKITGLRSGEKLLESLINETESFRLVKGKDYLYIKPPYIKKLLSDKGFDYNSKINPLTKKDLKELMERLNLLNKTADY